MTSLNSELLDWTPEWIANWHEWKRTFEEATRVDEKLGLLRIGFHVSMDGCYGEPDYKTSDRICYYLRLADGHCNSSNMHGKDYRGLSSHTRMSTPHGEEFKFSDLRLLVTRAAFDVLAINLFKTKSGESRDSSYDRGYYEWVRTLCESNVLRELMYFFRIAPGYYPGRHALLNFPDKFYDGNKHNGELARQFLDDLIRLAWKFRNTSEHPTSQDEVHRRQLDRIKPHLVRIMAHTGRIWWLLRPDFPIDDLCMRILERSALIWKMGRDMPIHGSEDDRNATTVEEAAADGCQTAQVVLLLRNREREKDRLEEIREAKQEAKNLEHRVKILQG